MRWYGHILRMNKARIPKKGLNMKVKGKWPRGRVRTRYEQEVRKYVTQNGGRKNTGIEEELWKDKDDGEAWLSHHSPDDGDRDGP
jgi:hypothetical protein